MTWIETTEGTALSSERATDVEGRVRYEALGAGAYRIACRRSDCWSASLEATLSADEHAQRSVQMRRLADLELTVLDGRGVPVAGVPVELRSSEFDCGVQAWIEAERVRAPSGLVTDGTGKLAIEGLPRGPYGWSIGLEGQDASGGFELAPGRKNEVLVRLP